VGKQNKTFANFGKTTWKICVGENRNKINLFIVCFCISLYCLFFVCIPWLAFNCKNTFNPLIKWPAGRMRDPESGGQVWKSRAIAWVFLFALQLNLIAFWRVINPKQWQPKNYAPPSASIVLSLTHWLHLFSTKPRSRSGTNCSMQSETKCDHWLMGSEDERSEQNG